jgi:TRAP-type C4-dicarboxylate transport system permease small subunit
MYIYVQFLNPDFNVIGFVAAWLLWGGPARAWGRRFLFLSKSKGLIDQAVRAIEWVNEWSGILSGIGVIIGGVVICYEIVVRYWFGQSAVWQTEFSIYTLIFATFIGSAYALKHNGHVSIDIVTTYLPPRVNAILRVCTMLLSLCFLGVLAWKGWIMWWEAYTQGWRSSSLWNPPLTIPYLLLPVGISLTGLQCLAEIYKQGRIIMRGAPPRESSLKTH